MIALNFGPWWSMRRRRLATLVGKAAQETQASLDFVAASTCEAATSHEMKGYWKGSRLDELYLQINSDLFPDQNAPGLQGCVPNQTEILAIYSSGSG